LRGLGPKFRVSYTNQQNPTLPTLSTTTHVAQDVVSLEEVLGDARTRILHLEGYMMWFKAFLVVIVLI